MLAEGGRESAGVLYTVKGRDNKLKTGGVMVVGGRVLEEKTQIEGVRIGELR